jgi:hypothetical protein
MPDIEFSTRIPAVRMAPENDGIRQKLGLLAGLAGSWQGHGFNLIARPDKEGNAPLFLELNQTDEHLKIDPIGSPIPNRGFVQDDIELAGLTYLQKISDSVTGGALHIEPGIWITIPSADTPPVNPNAPQVIGRMGTIPHGNSLLAGGMAQTFSGAPTLAVLGAPYAFSLFPSFNSAPIAIPATGAQPPPVFAVKPPGSVAFGPAIPGGVGFHEYDLNTAFSAANPRTPYGNVPPIDLPPDINGVSMQSIINDPILLLQQVINKQVADGHTFEGVVLNIATQSPISFLNTAQPPVPIPIAVQSGGGGIENIPFLQANADTALVYATFWIEEVVHPNRPAFTQLQYAQMVLLNFPALGVPGPQPPFLNFSWPHISVATLKRTFL